MQSLARLRYCWEGQQSIGLAVPPNTPSWPYLLAELRRIGQDEGHVEAQAGGGPWRDRGAVVAADKVHIQVGRHLLVPLDYDLPKSAARWRWRIELITSPVPCPVIQRQT